tara:strand:- start:11527 stop:12921 length:1395 start_codon:yes stop_codon:yes gene_type:complete
MGFHCCLVFLIYDPVVNHLVAKQRCAKYQETPAQATDVSGVSIGKNWRALTVCVLLCLMTPVVSPVAANDTSWKEDGWLRTALANERLDSGDEFGCYGIPSLSWNADPGAVALECRNYISERVSASRWANHSLSTFTPAGLTMNQHSAIASQGFVVHGDLNELSSTAWHGPDDAPEDDWDWYNLGRRGGSLEQIIGSKDTVQLAVEEGGLVNLYWVGRVNDATIRHDRDIISYLQDEAQAWMTTWGEAWSYWALKRCYELNHSSEVIGNQTVISFESILTEQCTAVSPLAWNVPVTWMFDLNGSDVVDVRDGEGSLSILSDSKNTAEGFTQLEGEYLHLSVVKGHNVTIVLNSTSEYDVMGQTEFWNNYSAAVTIASHDTTDLFKWSKRFSDEPTVVFTWLVQPRDGLPEGGWIPFVVAVVTIATITSMMYVLKREGLGPFSSPQTEPASATSQNEIESGYESE